MRKLFAALALAATTVALPLATTPAHADHTLCDNEPSDTYVGAVGGLGVDTDDLVTKGTLYICYGNSLVVLRTSGHDTYCSYYNWRDHSNDQCFTT
jgi:hypothetical protein